MGTDFFHPVESLRSLFGQESLSPDGYRLSEGGIRGIAIHWFRRDLRLTDNTALNAALAAHDLVVPVLITSEWTGAHHWCGAPRQTFDPGGAYIKRWVPELSDVPAAKLCEPSPAGVSIAKGYPFPIVDHSVARDEVLEMFKTSKAVKES